MTVTFGKASASVLHFSRSGSMTRILKRWSRRRLITEIAVSVAPYSTILCAIGEALENIRRSFRRLSGVPIIVALSPARSTVSARGTISSPSRSTYPIFTPLSGKSRREVPAAFESGDISTSCSSIAPLAKSSIAILSGLRTCFASSTAVSASGFISMSMLKCFW